MSGRRAVDARGNIDTSWLVIYPPPACGEGAPGASPSARPLLTPCVTERLKFQPKFILDMIFEPSCMLGIAHEFEISIREHYIETKVRSDSFASGSGIWRPSLWPRLVWGPRKWILSQLALYFCRQGLLYSYAV